MVSEAMTIDELAKTTYSLRQEVNVMTRVLLTSYS